MGKLHIILRSEIVGSPEDGAPRAKANGLGVGGADGTTVFVAGVSVACPALAIADYLASVFDDFVDQRL
jgi:hypothetical protein